MASVVMLSLFSCSKEPIEVVENPGSVQTDWPERNYIPVVCSIAECSTRSQVDASFLPGWESDVKDITIFQFDGQDLCRNYFFDLTKQEPKVLVLKDEMFTFFAMANCGDVRSLAPVGMRLDSFRNLVYGFPELKSAEGMPMAGEGSIVSRSGKTFLEFSLERLLTKTEVFFANSVSDGSLVLEHGRFVINSLVEKSAPSRITPFVGSYRVSSGGQTCVFDSATDKDIASLNKGGCATFYCGENMFGNLLPSGSSTKDRLPSKIGDAGGLATYFEIGGVFTDLTGKLTIETVMRLYLGYDSRNFDVKRNVPATLRLSLSDSHHFAESSWRMEPKVKDERIMAFKDASYPVSDAYPTPVVILLNGQAATAGTAVFKAFEPVFTLSPNLVEAGAAFDNAKLQLNVVKTPVSEVRGTLTMTSWDGRQKAVAEVILKQGIEIGGGGSGTGDSQDIIF